ncbi:hypothetical protein SS1G_07023 [Sclerotinia sclerotiorum 1980 UF-70]|uniref:Uncharacterized protein n=2 Tax=Sclerotinia sclerotiorum (strain ATCC 18683 / 1980 / Ss-1) TaxID=665079 RepID=A7ENX4_SCLS1|nr:hypothetical protein SS1G_07023 [Sclerotinia sclerotiorum 1980 UF-70]APA10468.1 hypothetical protein sscle_06g052380 [Sclerotinia sclerotiorum 1980 UF-70]EDO04540.1 hypothetical protein SS1G_07023 [Sclerotinia sclerotiorum 1980 UF-70]
MTPRKPRQRQNHPGPSQLSQVQVSDYDTETPVPGPAPPSRTNEELNLSVLRRYHPSIQKIKSLAASATMYMFSLESKTWEKLPIEGTLFVCELSPSPTTGAEDYCIVVLNRKGLNNVIYNLSEMNNVEITGEYLYWTVEKSETVGGTPVAKAFGIFIHDDETSTRVVNQTEILNNWKKTQATMNDVQALENKVENYGDRGFEGTHEAETVTEAQGGRRLSITDLFGGR